MGKKHIGGRPIEEDPVSNPAEAPIEAHAPADEYGWRSYPVVIEVRKTFRNPIGRDVTIKAEIRSPEGRPYLRYAMGRIDAKSPIGLARQGFFEDLPHAIELLISLYEKGCDAYVESESMRIRHNLEKDLDRVEDVVDRDTKAWKGRLQFLRQQLLSRLLGADDVS
jgi:hypothetical protein